MSGCQMFVSVQEGFVPLGIDLLNQKTGKGTYSGETLEEIKLRNSNVVVMDVDAFRILREDSAKSTPVKISEESYIGALECLPPLDYVRRGGTESFKMTERYVGQITSVYARIGSTFWSFKDVDTITHQEILARIAAVGEQDEPLTPA